MSQNKDIIELEGEVIECLPNTTFRVKLDNGHAIIGHIAGKMKMFGIKIILGDRVTVEMSPYDLTRGRITFRSKQGKAAIEPSSTAETEQ